MDVRQYYRKLREAEITISETYPLMVSLETTDGGKPGIVSEVSREAAAKLIVEGRAVPATLEEQELHRERQFAARQKAETAEMARRVQVAIISDSDLHLAGMGSKPLSGGK